MSLGHPEAEHVSLDKLENELQDMRSKLEQIGTAITTDRVKDAVGRPAKVYDALSAGLDDVARTLQALRNAGEAKSADIWNSVQSKLNAFRSRWVRDMQYLKTSLNR